MNEQATDFAHQIIVPALVTLGLDKYRLSAATALLLGTAIQESDLTARVQHGGGPALGLFQMEPATHDDIWENFLAYRPNLARQVEAVAGTLLDPAPPKAALLETSDAYAAAMCRVHYQRMGQIVGQTPIPDEDDIAGLAHYWKIYYNTPKGAGTEAEFIGNWNRFQGK